MAHRPEARRRHQGRRTEAAEMTEPLWPPWTRDISRLPVDCPLQALQPVPYGPAATQASSDSPLPAWARLRADSDQVSAKAPTPDTVRLTFLLPNHVMAGFKSRCIFNRKTSSTRHCFHFYHFFLPHDTSHTQSWLSGDSTRTRRECFHSLAAS